MKNYRETCQESIIENLRAMQIVQQQAAFTADKPNVLKALLLVNGAVKRAIPRFVRVKHIIHHEGKREDPTKAFP